MVTASDYWTSFQNLDRESEHAQKIEGVLNTANFSLLCSSALQIRRTINANLNAGQVQVEPLTCSIDSTKFASGQYNVVVELRFSDSKNWVARIRLPVEADSSDEIESSILSEIATMRLVRSRTSVPVPRLYGFGIAAQNAF
ncbi:MAG: hypothetical protein M1818_004448 [Claussenomyces sp. TS43310]|nr:MAG: hypothetical protein M1818_004448 [Claussenomyces sp. TS43310]